MWVQFTTGTSPSACQDAGLLLRLLWLCAMDRTVVWSRTSVLQGACYNCRDSYTASNNGVQVTVCRSPNHDFEATCRPRTPKLWMGHEFPAPCWHVSSTQWGQWSHAGMSNLQSDLLSSSNHAKTKYVLLVVVPMHKCICWQSIRLRRRQIKPLRWWSRWQWSCACGTPTAQNKHATNNQVEFADESLLPNGAGGGGLQISLPATLNNCGSCTGILFGGGGWGGSGGLNAASIARSNISMFFGGVLVQPSNADDLHIIWFRFWLINLARLLFLLMVHIYVYICLHMLLACTKHTARSARHEVHSLLIDGLIHKFIFFFIVFLPARPLRPFFITFFLSVLLHGSQLICHNAL